MEKDANATHQFCEESGKSMTRFGLYCTSEKRIRAPTARSRREASQESVKQGAVRRMIYTCARYS